jgi:hypothetical protein
MAVQLQGNGGTIADVDGALFRALKMSARPIDTGALGHYRLSQTIPLVATQAANGTLFSWRWGDATRLAVLTKMRLTLLQTLAHTATIYPVFQAFIARGFTASDSVGSAVTLTGNSMKKRTSMGTTLLTDARSSAVAAGLTVGTRTLDAAPIMEVPTAMLIVQTVPVPTNTLMYEKELDIGMGDGNYPYVFAQNEGFIVRGPTIVFGAAGTANLIVDISWAEVAAFG